MPQHRPLARSDGRVNARLSPAGARPLPSTPSAEGTAWGRTPKPNKKRRRPRGPVGTRCPSTRTCTVSTRPGPAHLRGHPARKPWGLAPAVLPPGGTGRRLGTSVVITPGRGQGCRSAPRSVQDGPAEDDRWPRGPCSDLRGNVHAARTAHAGPWGARARAGVRFRAPPAPSGAAQTGALPGPPRVRGLWEGPRGP